MTYPTRRTPSKRLTPVLVCVALVAFSHSLGALDPSWTRILTGNVTAGPVCIDDRVFVGTSDRSVTCVSADGRFLWSRPVPGGPAVYLSASSGGMLLVAGKNGSISAYNPDGRFLWRLTGSSVPTAAPIPGRDGRAFVLYEKRIHCIGPSSGLKWSLPVDFTAAGHAGETGDGDLVLSTKDGFIARVSPYGGLLERIAVAGTVTWLESAPSGFFAGFQDGSVGYCHVRPGLPARGRESVFLWRSQGGDPCRALSYLDGTLAVARRSGVIDALNATDGSPLWSVRGANLDGQSVTSSAAYGQFTFASSSAAISLTPGGRVLYSHSYKPAHGGVALSPEGHIFVPGADWALRSFRPETRISDKKRPANPAKYGILEGRSIEYAGAYFSGRDAIAGFFAEVLVALEGGTVGPDEVGYARRLVDILSNDSGDPMFPRDFDEHERGRAASLLGAIGSTEYREPLLSVTYGPMDESLAIGVLHGLSLLGPDRDGRTLDAIERILRAAGFSSQTVQRSACSALYAVARYSTGEVSRGAVSMLIALTARPYGAQTGEYARALLASLLE